MEGFTGPHNEAKVIPPLGVRHYDAYQPIYGHDVPCGCYAEGYWDAVSVASFRMISGWYSDSGGQDASEFRLC